MTEPEETPARDGSLAADPFGHIAPTLDRLRAERREVRTVRISVPGRVIAFGRRDLRSPGFERAVDAAAALGFASWVRSVGGRFAPMHGGSLVVDEFGWSDGPEWPVARFERHSKMLADVFRSYGIDARVGEVPGEYCPGVHSVNRGGKTKLSGTAQRVARGAWLVSSVVQVRAVDSLREVTARVAAILGQSVDVRASGALSESVPDLRPDSVADRIARRFRDEGVTEITRIGRA